MPTIHRCLASTDTGNQEGTKLENKLQQATSSAPNVNANDSNDGGDTNRASAVEEKKGTILNGNDVEEKTESKEDVFNHLCKVGPVISKERLEANQQIMMPGVPWK